MGEPISIGLIATNCALGLVKGLSGKAAGAAATRVLDRIRKSRTPEGRDVLRATHSAFLRSIRLMANACEVTGGDPADQFSAHALAQLAQDPSFTAFDYSLPVEALPKALDAAVRQILESPEVDPAIGAADIVIASLEERMGGPLTEAHRSLFRFGSDKHYSWTRAFELFFADEVTANEAVFRALTFERLTEVLNFAASHASDLAELIARVQRSAVESAERGQRLERKVDAMIHEVMALRGGQIAAAHIDRAAIVLMARKVSENVQDFNQALAEIDAAIDDLLALRRDAARGSNLDALVEATLRRIDERAAKGQFDAAAREAAAAFDEWQARETDRREHEQAVGLRFADENIRTNRLRRDPAATAEWILRKAHLDQDDDRQLEVVELKNLVDSGKNRGINFDLEIAIALAARLYECATSRNAAASVLVWKGIALQALGERQEGADMLNAAVHAYRAALDIYTRDGTPFEWAMAQNNLGTALSRLGERQEDALSLDEAAAAYRSALEIYSRERLPDEWATIQNNLGTIFGMLGVRRGEQTTLEDAVSAFRQALEVRTRDRLPFEWSTTQNNLGNALRELGSLQEGTQAIKEAITAHESTLEVRTRERFPVHWALTKHNLGNAFARMGERQGDMAFFERAIVAYKEALEVWSPEQSPLDWAMAQNNLGNVLLTISASQQDSRVTEEAISAFRRALQIYTRESLPLDWAMAQNNLGNALSRLGQGQGDQEVLDQAAQAYRAASEVYTRESFPFDWAGVQANIGAVLAALAAQQANSELLTEAITACRGALEIFERERFPLQWAKVQENLGHLLVAKVNNLADCALAREAVAAFQGALEVFDHPDLSANRAKAMKGLRLAQTLRAMICKDAEGL